MDLLFWLGADVDQCPVGLAVRHHALALARNEVAHRTVEALPGKQTNQAVGHRHTQGLKA